MRLLGGLLVGGLLIAVLGPHAPEASAQKKKKKKGTEAGVLNPIGRPKFAAGQPARVAIWHDGSAWHIRATCKKGMRAQFNGRVDVDDGAVSVTLEGLDKEKRPEDADWVRSLPKKRGFEFQIVTFGLVDGFTFKPSPEAKEVSFQLRVDQDDDPKKIFIGAAGAHPEKANFMFPAHPVLNPK